MAVDDSRLLVRRELEQLGLSMESASWIVDDRPPGGWGEIVTREHLHLELATLRADVGAELAALRAELRGEIADVRIEIAGLAAELRAEMRDQTRWLTGVLIVAMGVVATVSAAAATLAGAV